VSFSKDVLAEFTERNRLVNFIDYLVKIGTHNFVNVPRLATRDSKSD